MIDITAWIIYNDKQVTYIIHTGMPYIQNYFTQVPDKIGYEIKWAV